MTQYGKSWRREAMRLTKEEIIDLLLVPCAKERDILRKAMQELAFKTLYDCDDGLAIAANMRKTASVALEKAYRAARPVPPKEKGGAA